MSTLAHGDKDFGFVEWFRPGEHERTEAVLPEIEASGAAWLRTHISWAEFLAPGGPEWFDWLLPRLARRLDLLPCILYTPPSLSRTGRTNGAPRRLRDYADFVDQVMTRYGQHFTHVELWNEPNNLLDWDWREDVDFKLFCEMIGDAAHWVNERGWKVVLGGPAPFDPYWLDLMGQRGLLDLCAAVGFHGFPGTWDSEAANWGGWDLHLGEMRSIVKRYNSDAEIWITETGYSTWRKDEVEQARRFVAALDVPAERTYWYSWRDVPHDVAVQEGFWFDARHYHLGAVDDSGNPKLLARCLLDGGVNRVRELMEIAAPTRIGKARPVVITGGSGFIGSNLAERLLADGEDVIILDNLCRAGVDQNLAWLKERYPDRLHPFLADVRDPQAIRPAFADAKAVFHLAAQTAVTTSLHDPVDDFEVNARGTLNVLEAVRGAGRRAPVVLASTNKVYGDLGHIKMVALEDRYVPAVKEIREAGIDERAPLDFRTPYGCSKGVADQYVLDYGASFGIPAAAIRMSCIYGPRQFGTEDQGWVAHFLLCALAGRPITVYGDGRQVRDILHVADAVDAYCRVMQKIDALAGRAFNLGGGPSNAVSLRRVLAEISLLTGRETDIRSAEWRAGDQLYFVADTRKLQDETGWRPATGWQAGLRDLEAWLRTHRIPQANSNAGARRLLA
ncbi:MAG: NAD-dependent epimerase/dehydratase family protein [Zhengella sp.]|uniref:NAD-dependent epimerase/dehydratase family protein n=1 Tax=Zhengella sp. TaxID=2282762 RepID=UPI001D6BF84D|nr:NAD-dependent epimerase/dehydratase family protein [Notoacmeibacter sp.]MCC0027077.1 NAD-dependent epimerase/dehydratase family protein [Brucellaceae bacterium]